MEKLITAIHTMSAGKEHDLSQLRKLLEEPQNKEFIQTKVNIPDVFQLLNPAAHTVAWAILLNYAPVKTQGDKDAFLQFSRFLIAECDPRHLRLVEKHYFGVCRKLTGIFATTTRAICGIRLLGAAIARFQITRAQPGELLPMHADLLQLCILARTYKFAATHVLNQEITSVVDYDNSEAFLRYMYYAGIIYTGLHDYGRAISSFKMTFSVPATTISAIAVEAYKKFLLCSLIEQGQVASLGKYVPSMMLRAVRPLCAAYTEFVSVYSSHDPDAVHKFASSHVEAFKQDRNFGLVKQSIKAMYRHNIQRHTRTYVTLPLKDIGEWVKLTGTNEVKDYILRMIEDGKVLASINMKDGMVSFHDDAETYNSFNTVTNLSSRIKETIALDRALKKVDEDLQLERNYIQKTQLTGEKGGHLAGMQFDEDEALAQAMALSTATM